MANTRQRSLEAAVHLVGTQGVRTLTHTRVDAAAGLPRGSTSNWFRTRDALVAGVVTWIAEQERADVTAATAPVDTVEDLIDALTRLLEDATGHHVVRTRARYALFFEMTSHSDMQAPLREQRSLFEDWTRAMLAGLRAEDPDAAARTLLAVSAGLIVNRLTVAPDVPVRSTLERAVRGILPA